MVGRPNDADPALPDLDGLNKILEHRARLAICVLLSKYDAMNFRRLKEVLEETDGNLGAQLRKLEDNGYIKVKKTFEDRKPVSWYRLTEGGRRATAAHLHALNALLSEFEE